MKLIKLTNSQINNLIDFLEFYFIKSIQEDTSIDNMDYLVDMCEVFVKLKNAKDEVKE